MDESQITKLSERCQMQKAIEAIISFMYDYMIFWKKQIYKERKQINGTMYCPRIHMLKS